MSTHTFLSPLMSPPHTGHVTQEQEVLDELEGPSYLAVPTRAPPDTALI